MSELSDREVSQVREELRAFLALRPDLSPADLTPHTTLGDATIRSFLNRSIRGGRQVVTQIRAMMARARTGDILQPHRDAGIVIAPEQEQRTQGIARFQNWYETQTVRRVAEVLDYCAAHAAIGIITAEFGVGKSAAVRAWRLGKGRKIPTAVFEFDEFSSANTVEFICCLAKQLGLEVSIGSQNAGRVFRVVCEKLRSEPVLLVFDQCETLRTRVFSVIRQCWDRSHEAGVGIVLLAAKVLMTRMLGSRMADLGALTSRVGVWAALNGFTKSEMAAIIRQEGVTDIDDMAFELWYRATGGSMRRLMWSLELLQAKHSGKRVTEKTIRDVAGHLWGMQLSGGDSGVLRQGEDRPAAVNRTIEESAVARAVA